MCKTSLKRIYDFLNLYVLEKLEYPCDNCGFFECKKNSLNSGDIIKKRYKWNDINWRHCLKREKKELKELMEILRLPEFREWSYEKCVICRRKFFKHNMKIHSETEKEGHMINLPSRKEKRVYEIKIFRLCKKCNLCYVHRKNALNKGFKKS